MLAEFAAAQKLDLVSSRKWLRRDAISACSAGFALLGLGAYTTGSSYRLQLFGARADGAHSATFRLSVELFGTFGTKK